MTADGHGVMAIMREVGVSKTTVWPWQEYFAEASVEGLWKVAPNRPAGSQSAQRSNSRSSRRL